MKKSCLVLGGLFLLALAAGIAVLAVKVPNWWADGKRYVEAAMAEQKRIDELEKHWTPPSENPDAAWAPAQLGDWKLKQTETECGWPDLNVPQVAQRMIYENNGQTIEIGVMTVNAPEKEAGIERIVEAAKTAGSGCWTTNFGNRAHVRSGNLNTRVWWLKNRLFVFRSKDVDPLLGEQYLHAISGGNKAEME